MYDTPNSAATHSISVQTSISLIIVCANRESAALTRRLDVGFVPELRAPTIKIAGVIESVEALYAALLEELNEHILISGSQTPTRDQFVHLISSERSVWDERQQCDVKTITKFYYIYIPNPVIKPGTEVVHFDLISSHQAFDLATVQDGLADAINVYTNGTRKVYTNDRSEEIKVTSTKSAPLIFI